MNNVELFVKHWKEELRSLVQPIVKAGKRKPTITIIRVGDTSDSGMEEMCKEVGFIGDIYRIPIDSGIKQEDLWELALQCDTDEVYVEEPLPDAFYNPVSTGEYTKKGILTFLKSLNIDPPVSRVVIAFAAEGYEVQVGEQVLTQEDVKLLEQMAVLESGIEYWKDEIGESK